MLSIFDAGTTRFEEISPRFLRVYFLESLEVKTKTLVTGFSLIHPKRVKTTTLNQMTGRPYDISSRSFRICY